MNLEIQQYISDRVVVDETTGCWMWSLHTDDDGYGRCSNPIKIKFGERKAHRLSFIGFKHPIPTGLQVRHKCRNRSCCNPDHLELGTQVQNNLDKKRDGTEAKGESHGCAKLTEEQVLSIRYKYRTEKIKQVDLAREFGVSKQVVNKILNRKLWVHI